jgi:hypothetical protein
VSSSPVAKATKRQRKLDYMREIPLVHCAGRFALAAAHGKLVSANPARRFESAS